MPIAPQYKTFLTSYQWLQQLTTNAKSLKKRGVVYLILSALICKVHKQAKKLIVFILVLGISLPDAVLHYVASVPALAAHYYHHITEHENIGIVEFLTLHAAEHEHMKADAHEHKHLPGSDNKQHCQHAQIIPIVPGNAEISLVIPEILKTVHLGFLKQYLPQSKATAIWQPPKQA